MEALIWHFLIGLGVGFASFLTPGTVNLTVIQTSINVNFRAGFYLALGVTLMELFYSALGIKFISILLQNSFIALIIQMICIPLFLILGYMYFNKEEMDAQKSTNLKKSTSFYNGLFIGFFNPLQIPFWLAYGSILLSNPHVKNEPITLNFLIAGICFGTISVLTLFAYLSRWIMASLDIQTKLINKVMGLFFIGLSLYQAYLVTSQFI